MIEVLRYFMLMIGTVIVGLTLVGIAVTVWQPFDEGKYAKRNESYINSYKFFGNAWLYDMGYRFTRTSAEVKARRERRIQKREENARKKGFL